MYVNVFNVETLNRTDLIFTLVFNIFLFTSEIFYGLSHVLFEQCVAKWTKLMHPEFSKSIYKKHKMQGLYCIRHKQNKVDSNLAMFMAMFTLPV